MAVLIRVLNGFYATRYSRRLLPEVNKFLIGPLAAFAGSHGMETDPPEFWERALAIKPPSHRSNKETLRLLYSWLARGRR